MSTKMLGRRPGAYAADPRVHRMDDPLSTGRLAEIRPAALAADGRELLVLTEPVGLGEDAEFDVRFLCLLREAMSVMLRVDWTARSPGTMDPSLVCHLPPPRTGPATGEDGLRDWRDRYRFGLCYYRIGPGFVVIKDTRNQEAGVRFRLDDPPAVAAFAELEQAVHLPSAGAETRELFELLAGERLAVRNDAWATVLPFRMRRWPVPWDAV
jgi:hypothetical protein